jgi:hypothetical protein
MGGPPFAARGWSWLPTDADAGRRISGSDDLDEPPELVVYCPKCEGREFGEL